MELPPLSKLLLATQTSNTELANISLGQLTLPKGTTLAATIESIRPLPDALRQSLLNQLVALTTERELPSSALATFTTAQRLNLLNALVQNPHSAGLTENAEPNKNNTQGLLQLALITPLQLLPRTQLILSSTGGGHLKLISQHPQTTSQSHLLQPTPSALSRADTLQQGLREYVAFSEPLVHQQTRLAQLERHLASLPAPIRETLISPKEQALFSALTGPNLRSTHQITPQYVAHRIADSGHFLESKLAQSVGSPPQSNPATPAPDGNFRYAAISKDTKQQLLESLQLASTALFEPGTKPNARAITGNSLAEVLQRAAASVRQTDTLIAQLHKLLPQKSQSAPPENLQKQLHNLLRATAALGIARISANQLQQLSVARQETAAATATHVEFLVRLQDQILPVNLWIQERYMPDSEQKDEAKKRKKQKKSRAWRLFLELELPNDGKFASEVTYCNEKIQTRVWTETETLQTKTQRRLKHLKEKLIASGIDVEKIQLEPGAPPKQQCQVHQQLIDVQT